MRIYKLYKPFTLLLILSCVLSLPTPVQSGGVKLPKKIAALGKKLSKTTPLSRTAQPAPVRRPVPSARLQKPDLAAAQSHLQTLNARVERSIQHARQARANSNHFSLIKGPIDRSGLFGPGPFHAEYLYPDKLYLQHPELGAELTEAYFVAQSNRLYAKYLREMDQHFWPAFEAARTRFYEEAQALEQPENLLKWTAEQIPASTQNLFIGEIHGNPEIPHFVDELLQLLHQQNPGRKIFFFSEFLRDLEGKDAPVTEKIIPISGVRYRMGLWKTAELLDIPLIGLETDKWPYDYDFVRTDPYETPILAGATAEGLRIRNNHWHTILQKYRQQNPDALFVIYTGSAHSLYNFPFSLAKRFPKETTLMLDVTMEELRFHGEFIKLTDHLELLDADHMHFPQPVLKWSSPDLIELSGFDMRVKLPVRH